MDTAEYREAMESFNFTSRNQMIEFVRKAINVQSTRGDIINYLRDWDNEELAHELEDIDDTMSALGYYDKDHRGCGESQWFADPDLFIAYIWELLQQGFYVVAYDRDRGTAFINPDDIGPDQCELTMEDIYGQKEN